MKIRQHFRFRLRTLLIVFALISVWLGAHMRSTRMQRKAVQAIQDCGGAVRYDFQYCAGEWGLKYDKKAKSIFPYWSRKLLGNDFFHDVVQVSFGESHDPNKAFRELLQKIRQQPSQAPTQLTNLSSVPQIAVDSELVNALRLLQDLPSLQIVILRTSHATDTILPYFAKISGLRTLMMHHAKYLGDNGVASLRHLNNLKVISISESQITDKSLQVLGGMNSMEYITLQKHAITDRGLLNLSSNKNIRVLHVCGHRRQPNGISDEGLKYLMSLSNLEALCVENTCVTSDGVSAFNEIFPLCKVRH